MYVGIDPGESGGIAVLHCNHVEDRMGIKTYDMPDTERVRWLLIQEIINDPFDPVVIRIIIERVTGFIPPRKGTDEENAKHSGNPGSSMFVFGQNYGGLRMALIACDLREEETWRAIGPGVWQKALGIQPRQKGEKKPAFKRRLKEFALQMYPEIKSTLQTADALLIAEYCRRLTW